MLENLPMSLLQRVYYMSLLLGYDQPLIYSRSSQLYSLKCENKIVPLTKYQTSEMHV